MRHALTLIPALLFLVALQPFAADAGRKSTDEAVCSKQTVFNGETIHGCFGTMAGFRNHPDPEALAELRVRGDGMQSFQARLNGVYFLCVFEDSYDLQYFAAIANNYQNTRFVIGSRDGKCDTLGASLATGSRYGEY